MKEAARDGLTHFRAPSNAELDFAEDFSWTSFSTNRTLRTIQPKSSNPHHLQRDFLLYKVGLYPRSGRKAVSNGLFGNTAPAPVPHNNQPCFGNCQIWRGTLSGTKSGSDGGYPLYQGKLVHRLVYEESRGARLEQGQQVLHLCHRRSCIQPSHLYSGNDKDNAEDRERRFNTEMSPGWPRVETEFSRASGQSSYTVDDTPSLGLKAEPMWLDHSCQPGPKAGMSRICQICDMTDWLIEDLPTLERIMQWEQAFPQQKWEWDESTVPYILRMFRPG